MIEHRLECAKIYLKDAFELYKKGRFNSSASRAYVNQHNLIQLLENVERVISIIEKKGGE